jgi:hypothetical protein
MARDGTMEENEYLVMVKQDEQGAGRHERQEDQ